MPSKYGKCVINQHIGDLNIFLYNIHVFSTQYNHWKLYYVDAFSLFVSLKLSLHYERDENKQF